MNKAIQRVLAALSLGFVVLLTCPGCTAPKQDDANTQTAADAATSAKPAMQTDEGAALTLADCPVLQDTNFGGVFLDITIDEFNKLGFKFGDSLDVKFSNGYELHEIPYFNGYYVRPGEPLVVGYPGYPHVEVTVGCGDSFWNTAGVSQGDTATVTLAQAGAYLNDQEAFDISYSNDRSDYKSDEQFANFRSLFGGSLRKGAVYRSASPIDNEYGRAPYVEALMKKAGVAYVLDLSDNSEEIDSFLGEDAKQGIDTSHFVSLRKANAVSAIDLSANYTSQDFAKKLASGFVQMSQHDGPYLLHCIEGKDRTGFACIVLEALCGATYEELATDYMTTFYNYYGISKEKNPEKYDAIVALNLHSMLSFLANVGDDANLRSLDYKEPARAYLRSGGMTDEQIDALVSHI